MDRNHKVVRQRATDLALLRPVTSTHKESETNEVQSLRSYIDEQREQMQQIIWGMQNNYKRLARTLVKPVVTNFTLYEVETRENARDSSATDWHD